MYTFKLINNINELSRLIVLAQECFVDDPFYSALSTKASLRVKMIGEIFERSFKIAIDYGMILAHYNDNEAISFSLWIDYKRLRESDYEAFSSIFPNPNSKTKKNIDYGEYGFNIISEMTREFPLCLYLVAICVKAEYRKQGLASEHVDFVNNVFPHYNLFSDISNPASLPIYLNRGFVEYHSTEDITYIARYTKGTNILFDSELITLAIPKNTTQEIEELLDGCPRTVRKAKWLKNFNQHAFFPDLEGRGTEIECVVVNYKQLLKYQKIINLTNYEECILQLNGEEVLGYVGINDWNKKLTNPTSTSIPRYKLNTFDLISRKEENFSPDVYIELPITYQSIRDFYDDTSGSPASPYARKIIYALNFRTTYEAGNLSNDNSGFKQRIDRYYIGSVNMQLFTESTIDFNQPTDSVKIGNPLEVPLILSIDNKSNCGVIHIAIPSCALPISQLMDTVSRNQIYIVKESGQGHQPLFQYLDENYKIRKSGSPKCFLTIFEDRKNIDDDFIGALLFGETYYEDNTGLGMVVDTKIKSLLASDYGIAQYNYATVYCYKNSFIQMTSRFRTSVNDRIIQESITLFYLELILFEESAISDVEEKISRFLNKLDGYTTSTVMANINTILSNYAKSSDFWDIPMNYPSSRKSVEEIRNAFQINKLREDVSRKKETLLNICTIRDTILDATEGYFISIIGIIMAAFSCNSLIDSDNLRQIIGFVLILIILFLTLRFRMNRKIRLSKLK